MLISFSNNKRLIQENSLSLFDYSYNIKTNQILPEEISKLRSKRKIELDEDIIKNRSIKFQKGIYEDN